MAHIEGSHLEEEQMSSTMDIVRHFHCTMVVRETSYIKISSSSPFSSSLLLKPDFGHNDIEGKYKILSKIDMFQGS